jgi:CubicO group peptidase (beta-lactamase class C family)
MKRNYLFLALPFLFSSLGAQNFPDAFSSDPDRMGWMKGFPPPAEKTISAADGSFFTFPALRYSVNCMREFYPTREVKCSREKSFVLKEKIDGKIDDVEFLPWGENEKITWREAFDRNYTDGIIVLHKGKIVYEKYSGGLSSDGLHAAMSVSKSFAGTVAAILVADGQLDDKKRVVHYIPELENSGFADATVRQVMDMTTSIIYSEDYNDPRAEVWDYSAAGNPFRGENYSGPKNYYEYLKTIKKIPGVDHGTEFGYKTVNTELLGWIVSRATGKGMAELVSELIWKPMGAKFDAYYNIDPSGIAFSGGGLSLNLRDMALFGEMILEKGKIGGKQIIPKEAAEAVSSGGSAEAFSHGGYPLLKGWSYSNMWWITNNSHGAFMARGVHGQAIYIDPAAKMVVARFASNPLASNKYIDPISIPAYEALAEYFMKK